MMDARQGDTFIVWKLDRFGRNAMEVMERIEELGKRGVAFESLTERFETMTAMGKLIFGMHALFAQLERDVIRERTLAGMAAARARGRMPGQPSKLSKTQWAAAERLIVRGWSPAEVAEKYGVSRQTVYVRYPSERIAQLRAKKG
jgi:DNA invertase Pin-like site-specific DNA recombinase